jgi:hypothetical protein
MIDMYPWNYKRYACILRERGRYGVPGVHSERKVFCFVIV